MNVTCLRRAALVITAAALLGCGESPLGPVPPPPQASLIGSLLQATGLLGCTPMPTATATQTVGPGLVFQRAATLTMSYANCNLLGTILPKRIAYTTDALAILSYVLSLDNLFGKYVTGRLNHFSNYAIAW